MTYLILACVAIGIFIAYNAVMFGLFGMPASLSNTYYYLNAKWPGSGWAFTVMMWVVSLMLMPAWIQVSTMMGVPGVYVTFLAFLTCACLLFVATAPNFRSGELPNAVHMWSAKLAAIFALLWICIACWKIMYIIPIWIGVLWLIAWLTGTMKSGRDWWWEMCAFGPTFTAIIVETILVIL